MILRRKAQFRIDFWNAIDIYKTGKITRPDDLNPTIVVQILREILKPIRPTVKRVKSILASPGCMIRILDLPILPEADLKAAIRLNLAGLIPYETNKIEFNFSVLRENREQKIQTLLVALAPTEEVMQHVEILRRAGLEAEIITPDLLAIYNCFHWLRSGSESDTVTIVNIGADRSTICFYNSDDLPSFCSLALGGNYITRSIEKHFHTSFLNAEEIKIGSGAVTIDTEAGISPDAAREMALKQAAEQIANTIRAMSLDQQIRRGDNHLSKIILTGGGARLKQLDYYLADSLKIPVYVWNPFNEPALEGLIAPDIATAWGEMAVPVLGLAMEGEA